MLPRRDIGRLGGLVGLSSLFAACATLTPAVIPTLPTPLTPTTTAPVVNVDSGAKGVWRPQAPPTASIALPRLPVPATSPSFAVYEDSSPRAGNYAPLGRRATASLPLPDAPPVGRLPRLAVSAPERVGPPVSAAPRAVDPLLPVEAVTQPAPERPGSGPQAGRTPVVGLARARPATPPAPPAAETSTVDSPPATERTFARVGDRLELTLPDEGWIYLGDLRGQASGLSYRERNIGEGATSFTFRALRLGEFLLEFQLQDHRTGGEQRQHLAVSIVTPSELVRILASGGVSDGSAPGESERTAAIEEADRLYDDRLMELALAAYERVAAAVPAPGTADPHLDSRLGTLYALRGEWNRAQLHWERILALSDDESATGTTSVGSYRIDARLGVINAAIARGDASAVAANSAQLLELPSNDAVGEVANDAAALLHEAELWEPALLILRTRLHRGSSRWEAETRFRLASVLESGWSGRDLREARTQYLLVAQTFPASRFARPALDRVRYLDRNYFVVQ